MDNLTALEDLDEKLLSALQQPEQLDAGWLEQQLARRATLLQQVIAEGAIAPEAAQALVDRSRELKQQAELARTRLAEKMATLKKGKRSTQAYNQIKQQE
ncbi:hypothetical protein [Zobellella sp. DQSA1]|uniref:hypothetical protein n=1 Tax=Zobellella sp. DQSA1 TaxID=3342386 RepID=UPI0035C0483A